MKKYFLPIVFFALTFKGNAQTITDVDGNTYNTVTIGTQVWMKENLKTTKYNDGIAIPIVTDNTAWGTLTTPAYCWYNNDAVAYKNIYGALFNWYTVNTGKLCPTGWHIPSGNEWTTMKDFLIANGYNYDETTTGNKIAKSLASTTGWDLSTLTGVVGNTDYSIKCNLTGFTALPGGFRINYGAFYEISQSSYWWSATENSEGNAMYEGLYYLNYSLNGGYFNKKNSYSVRCLKDIPASLSDSNPVAGIVIYPTTVSNILNIDNIAPKSVISIISIGGKLFKTIIATYPHAEVNMSDLPAGVYFLRVNDSISKFVKL